MSQDTWEAILLLLTGALIGALISIRFSISARRPKLLVSGGGSGGNQQHQAWRINITNLPSFFGIRLDGESARDLHAQIRLTEEKAQSYPVFWGHQLQHRVTIEPGHQESLELFHWSDGADGYYVVDQNNEPVAKFQAREVDFIVTIHDRLSRKSEFAFRVDFDDSHLKNKPRLQIVHPTTLRNRWDRARSGLRQIFSAFTRG